ncbi:hypothetical protein LCGC14_0362310 [marine sediment metagenome]|uniref:Uncharacterized protein n=1 Tax=marine sediment metagenome TaxID=412755 RepID=A0A0F9WFY4_9ZZZZ
MKSRTKAWTFFLCGGWILGLAIDIYICLHKIAHAINENVEEHINGIENELFKKGE